MHLHRFIVLFLCILSPFIAADYQAKDYSHLLGMPGFNDELLQIHFKLYEGYVKNTNEIADKLKNTINPGSYDNGALRRRFGWEFDGMRLHEIYFDNLGGKKGLENTDPLFRALSDQFGSFEKWKQDFIATGMMRGVGWALLYYDPEYHRLFNVWINEHDTGHLVRGIPILVMDVFEHAYITQYKLDRAKYIEAFFNNINWETVSKRYRS
jgi:Fe-Mn family superoxide dismutase